MNYNFVFTTVPCSDEMEVNTNAIHFEYQGTKYFYRRRRLFRNDTFLLV